MGFVFLYNGTMNKITPRDFFTHVGTIVTLYVSAISLITLLFQVINILHPDSLDYYVDPYSSGIRWAVASLIIIFPLFLLLSWLLERDYNVFPEKRGLGIKRWLTFLTLFVTGAAIATDLIVLITSFLGGEISTRFVLKVVVVLVVAGFVFGYYIWDLRRMSQSSRTKMFAIAAAIVVLASIVGGFVVMGSPMTQRKMRFDAEKTADLQNIQWQIVNYWQQKRALPNALGDLSDPISGFMTPNDPESGEVYGYRKISNLSFELCANFNLENKKTNSGGDMYAYPAIKGSEQDNWQHAAGRACFERTIDPELYPPVPAAAVKRI